MHWSCHLLRFAFFKDKKLCSLFHGLCFATMMRTAKRPYRIRKWSTISPVILKTLTLYKLARLFSGVKCCSRDGIHFQVQRMYVVCKNALFERTSKQKNWKCIWNRVSDAKTRARELLWIIRKNNLESAWRSIDLLMLSKTHCSPLARAIAYRLSLVGITN